MDSSLYVIASYAVAFACIGGLAAASFMRAMRVTRACKRSGIDPA